MMAVSAREVQVPLITYEQYMHAFLTEEVEMRRYDIIDGVKEYVNSPNWNHQRIIKSLLKRFDPFEEKGIGYALPSPYDIVIRRSPLRTRQPDVLFISKEQLERGGGIPAEGPLEIAPELVVEILSSSETVNRLDAKIKDYISIGVRECWVVRPEPQTVELIRLSTEGAESAVIYFRQDSVQSKAFPDLAIPVADIFSE